jgi:hypothetical protein
MERKQAESKIEKSKKKAADMSPNLVHLVKGGGTHGHGGDEGGFYWHIYTGNKRSGYVFINIIQDEHFSTHPSIQIHINQNQRKRGIGRVAYKLACELSGYDRVYAHMRKSNIASRRAAEAAGFAPIVDNKIPQLSMVWRNELPRAKALSIM